MVNVYKFEFQLYRTSESNLRVKRIRPTHHFIPRNNFLFQENQCNIQALAFRFLIESKNLFYVPLIALKHVSIIESRKIQLNIPYLKQSIWWTGVRICCWTVLDQLIYNKFNSLKPHCILILVPISHITLKLKIDYFEPCILSLSHIKRIWNYLFFCTTYNTFFISKKKRKYFRDTLKK